MATRSPENKNKINIVFILRLSIRIADKNGTNSKPRTFFALGKDGGATCN